jgi:hypothetical protein
MAVPGRYSVMSACAKRSDVSPAKAAARWRSGSRNAGIGSAFFRPPPLKSVRKPNDTTRRLPKKP